MPAEALAVLEQEARASAELAQVSRVPRPGTRRLGKARSGLPHAVVGPDLAAGNDRL